MIRCKIFKILEFVDMWGCILKIKRAQNILIIRIDEDEEVISSISEALSSKGIDSGIIISFVGALKYCQLILKKGLEKSITTHMEVVGNGNVSRYKEAPFVHLHVAAGSGKDFWVGHLTRGIVDIFCEVAIIPIELKMIRKYKQSLADSGITIPYILDFK
jgi:predicted DNA-binding protein with PD1-like motif